MRFGAAAFGKRSIEKYIKCPENNKRIMAKKGVIETGVDKLVELVERKKKISIAEAAKELSVPKSVIEEWASFLEEKEIINTSYSLTNTYLVKREISKSELEKKKKEIESHKEAFVRKVESALALIEKETAGLSELKENFRNLSSEIEEHVKKVQKDLEKLERYEDLKKEIDNEIVSQRARFEEELEKVRRDIESKRKKYGGFLRDVDEEERRIEEEIKRSRNLEETEEILQEKITSLKKTLLAIEEGIKSERGVIKEDREHLERLKKDADELKEVFKEKQRELNRLVKESAEKEEKIIALQEKILKDIVCKKSKTSEEVLSAEKAKEKFREFFDRKIKTDILLDKISTDVQKLERDLQKLRDEAMVLELKGKTKGLREHIAELEKKFETILKRKKIFESEILQLRDIVHGKKK